MNTSSALSGIKTNSNPKQARKGRQTMTKNFIRGAAVMAFSFIFAVLTGASTAHAGDCKANTAAKTKAACQQPCNSCFGKAKAECMASCEGKSNKASGGSTSATKRCKKEGVRIPKAEWSPERCNVVRSTPAPTACTGKEGCKCGPDDTCDTDLKCVDGLCVAECTTPLVRNKETNQCVACTDPVTPCEWRSLLEGNPDYVVPANQEATETKVYQDGILKVLALLLTQDAAQVEMLAAIQRRIDEDIKAQTELSNKMTWVDKQQKDNFWFGVGGLLLILILVIISIFAKRKLIREEAEKTRKLMVATLNEMKEDAIKRHQELRPDVTKLNPSKGKTVTDGSGQVHDPDDS